MCGSVLNACSNGTMVFWNTTPWISWQSQVLKTLRTATSGLSTSHCILKPMCSFICWPFTHPESSSHKSHIISCHSHKMSHLTDHHHHNLLYYDKVPKTFLRKCSFAALIFFHLLNRLWRWSILKHQGGPYDFSLAFLGKPLGDNLRGFLNFLVHKMKRNRRIIYFVISQLLP